MQALRFCAGGSRLPLLSVASNTPPKVRVALLLLRTDQKPGFLVMKGRKPSKLPPEFRERKSKRARRRAAKRSGRGFRVVFPLFKIKNRSKKRTPNPCPQ